MINSKIAHLFTIVTHRGCNRIGMPVQHEFARCKKCGEDHYINKYGNLQVNGHTVNECINCAFKERGVRLW